MQPLAAIGGAAGRPFAVEKNNGGTSPTLLHYRHHHHHQ